ncbi:MAG: hypothetical protein SCAL_000431 [Candidatus Syntrophoarchaeum caldarius]|uniref:Uncharacterized protein n=1 Tax=Candidatus Syntropharchaeum caldarium TaxID=1838285 RepID=A0A1F2PCI5_9EURY|nr:MAG: hypothetical protein SCAL_000431 [Candidatus Syntrophoarchaeum caldarius]
MQTGLLPGRGETGVGVTCTSQQLLMRKPANLFQKGMASSFSPQTSSF